VPPTIYLPVGPGAHIPRVRDGDGWKDGEPAFYSVVVWRGQAVHAAESLAKGSRVVVVGRLAQRSWQADDGTTRSVAEELGPSLRWATATTTRATRSPSS
jgi:single-strand DNA-binding protein